MRISKEQVISVIDRIRLIAAIVLLSLSSPCVLAAAQSDVQTAALNFVTTHRIGSNMPQMALVVASRTQTFQIPSKALGPMEAMKRVQGEIALAAPDYQEQWDKHLADAYAKHFSAEELDSLNSEGPQSKYAAKLASMQKVVGDDMRQASQSMLTEMLRGVLQNVLSSVEK